MEAPDRTRGIFCNRTLNLRAIRAIGYDMDYTLLQYRMEAWERLAYEYLRAGLVKHGLPVGDLGFDPALVTRGLIIDTELGNVVKANRFGYVKRAHHGTRPLELAELRATYSRVLIELKDPRWVFLNTLFAISEGCMYTQLIDRLDAGQLGGSALGYSDLYRLVRRTLDHAHAASQLKPGVVAHPEGVVDLDPEMPLALLDQKQAGKTLLLITNSGWSFARPMLDYAFNRFLPGDMTWRELFDFSIVAARKPDFFSDDTPAYRIVDDTGLLREQPGNLEHGGVYVGGSAMQVERTLGLNGGEILYVGDHIFVDVTVTKNVLRWRTALIIMELEEEIAALQAFERDQAALEGLMSEKTTLETEHARLRLLVQRARKRYGPQPAKSQAELRAAQEAVWKQIGEIDKRISPLARASGTQFNARWGPLMRAGNDKSHLARQVERYADIYTSRVSNFLYHTPFVYLRSPRGSLPHDGVEGAPPG